MKISKIRNLVIGAMVATFVTGCGGSGLKASSGLPNGIYVPTFSGHTVKYVSNVNGSSAMDIIVPNNEKSTAVAVDATGKLYVGTYEGKVYRYTKFDGIPDELQVPAGKALGKIFNIAVDKSDRLYINDSTNHKIIRVDDLNGTGWTDFDYLPFLLDVNDSNDSLAIDSLNRIYIASRNGSQLIRFNDMSDISPTIFGTFGTGVGQARDIVDVHIDTQGHIFLADRLNSRIVRIDDMLGTNWVSFGTNGNGVNQFNEAWQVTTDPAGKIYVSDIINSRMVRINDMTGAGWTTFGSVGNGAGQYASIWDILVR